MHTGANVVAVMMMMMLSVTRCSAGFVRAGLEKRPSLVKRFLSLSSLEHKNLVSVQECLDAASQDGVVFCDASWYHKGGRNGRAEFEQGPRIAGARYIDMDDIATSKELFPELNPKGLRTMMPPKKLFAAAMDVFDIKNSDHVIIYAKKGTIFTPRTWFLFRSMGHDPAKVHLMQGSLEEWMHAGGAVDTEPTTVPRASALNLNETPIYQARDATQVVDMQEMLRVAKDGSSIIVDPRGSSFQRNGHIPGAIHLPYRSLVEPDNLLKLKPKQELLQIFKEASVDIQTEERIICSCGSGVSVCHLLLAMEECGRDFSQLPTVMYDGSYQEWGSDPDTPKVLPKQKE